MCVHVFNQLHTCWCFQNVPLLLSSHSEHTKKTFQGKWLLSKLTQILIHLKTQLPVKGLTFRIWKKNFLFFFFFSFSLNHLSTREPVPP